MFLKSMPLFVVLASFAQVAQAYTVLRHGLQIIAGYSRIEAKRIGI